MRRRIFTNNGLAAKVAEIENEIEALKGFLAMKMGEVQDSLDHCPETDDIDPTRCRLEGVVGALENIQDFLNRTRHTEQCTTYSNQSCVVWVHEAKREQWHAQDYEIVWHDGGPMGSMIPDLEIFVQLPPQPGLYRWTGSISYTKNWTDYGYEHDAEMEGDWHLLYSPSPSTNEPRSQPIEEGKNDAP